LRIVAKLRFLPLVFAPALVFDVWASVVAGAQSPDSTSSHTELVRPSSGNDTLKLASLGVVFLLIGAAVVYAPQIVSAVTRFPGRLLGRKPKPKKAAKAVRATQAPPPAAPPPAPVVVTLPEEQVSTDELQFAPPSPTASVEEKPLDVVARLQQEIRASWKK
jgi:hypothetical protein